MPDTIKEYDLCCSGCEMILYVNYIGNVNESAFARFRYKEYSGTFCDTCWDKEQGEFYDN